MSTLKLKKSIKFRLPKISEYFFDDRLSFCRSIEVVPIFGCMDENQITKYKFICLYDNAEKLEVLEIEIENIKKAYYNKKNNMHFLIKAWIDKKLMVITKKNFIKDLHKYRKYTINQLLRCLNN